MSEHCSNCEESFGYEPGWDDPPKGEGHIQVTFNPEDEPSFVVGKERQYCSAQCLLDDIDELPFDRCVETATAREEDDDLRADGGWQRDACPSCGGGLSPTGEKRRTGNASHHVRVYRCGNCGREVGR